MGRYIAQRILFAVITLFILASLSFFMMETLPGSPFNDDQMSDTQRELLYKKYELDKPVAYRYYKYMSNMLQGDLGISFQYEGRAVTTILGERLGPSATLGFQALIVGTFCGMVLGIFAALKHNTVWDYSAMLISVLGIAVPSFVVAGILQYWIGVKLQWLPIAFWESFAHTIMPTIVLSVGSIATVARFMRTEMLEVLNQDYMTTAVAKGLHPFNVVVFHGLRNGLISILTIMGPKIAALLTGSLVVEKVFSIPGIGELFTKSVMANDYSVIMGTTLFYAALYIVAILIIDILYGVVDPRIRVSGGKQ